MRVLDLLFAILAQGRYQLCFVLLLAVFLPILAITSDIIIIVPYFMLNYIADPLKIFLIALIGLLIALNGAVILHNYDLRIQSSRKTAFFGTVGALFTTACPICPPIWLVWFGFGSASIFLVSITWYMAIFSLVLLAISLYYSLKHVSGKCNIKTG